MKAISLTAINYAMLLISSCFNRELDYKGCSYLPLANHVVQAAFKGSYDTDSLLFRCDFTKTGIFTFDSIASVEGYSPAGHLRLEGRMKRSSPDGEWVFRCPNGNKERSCVFANGKLNGPAYSWYETGELKQVYYWHNGTMSGPDTRYFRNGKILSTDNFLDGKGNGRFTGYYENGRAKAQFSREMDKMVGPAQGWHENGRQLMVGMYDRQGRKDSTWSYWDSTGRLRKTVRYRTGAVVDSALY